MSTSQNAAAPANHDNQDGQDGGQRSRPGRTACRRGAANPNGSTNRLRSDVLGALGVLKVATADQR